jgi:hypothetical protein
MVCGVECNCNVMAPVCGSSCLVAWRMRNVGVIGWVGKRNNYECSVSPVFVKHRFVFLLHYVIASIGA